MKNQLRTRDTRVMELQVETDNLREQSARQSAIIDSLKKRLKDHEDRERDLFAAQGRNDMALQTLQRDSRLFFTDSYIYKGIVKFRREFHIKYK